MAMSDEAKYDGCVFMPGGDNPYKDAYDRVMNTMNKMSKCRICYKPVKYTFEAIYLQI